MTIARAASLAAAMPVTALTMALLVGPVADAAPEPRSAVMFEDTEDILYLKDGRVFHGNLISEDRHEVVFQYIDSKLNMRARLTFTTDEIDKIERDIPLEDAPAKTTGRDAKKTTGSRATSQPDDEPEESYGIRRGDADNEALPKFYVVPMKGQMGTDVSVDVYKSMMDDIREHAPDVLVIQMECRDSEDALYNTIGREEQGLADMDQFRDLVKLFRDELRDIRQVLWIKDSVGMSSTVALAWDELYMTPDARFGGMVQARLQTGFDSWADDDVRGKMTAAFMSWVKGFLEYGHYSLELADAMVRPEYQLSATWKGRDVEWHLDSSGEYVVDGSDKATANFSAKTAENFCISDGTAETIDDLALFLGYREFRVADAASHDIHEDYTEDWRRVLKTCEDQMGEYQKFMGWASGQDQLKYLGAAKRSLERVLSGLERYKAVETRLGRQYGINKVQLLALIEQLKEQIAALRRSGRPTGGTGGGGSGRGGMGGGG